VSSTWRDTVEGLHRLLAEVSFTDRSGGALDAEAGFAEWTRLGRELRAKKRTAFLVGNGASASMASHFSADLAKNAHVHTEVFTDLSLITAISNDMGYEHVYAEPLKRRAQTGDLLLAISSSGRSPNIRAATAVARTCGMTIVTLSAMSGENPLRQEGDLNIYLDCRTYGEAETGHAAVLHHWMDRMAEEVEG
jgi:D-sedoheptulose 7-phosphate isomerase